MTAPNSLQRPFETWREGLLNLADSLASSDRIVIAVARLEATAQVVKITLEDVCALALLAQSSARFDSSTFLKFEPHPTAVEFAKKVGASSQLDKVIGEFLDSIEEKRKFRETLVNSVFPRDDPRRLLKDTIFGFSAALLSDTAQKLGDADPYTRVARRLGLWFRQTGDFTRYGVPLAENRKAIADAAKGLTRQVNDHYAPNLEKLLQIWAGDVAVNADKQSIERICTLLAGTSRRWIGGLDSLIALEALTSLCESVEDLDTETIDELSSTICAVYRSSQSHGPATTDFRRYISSGAVIGERLQLAYDPFSLMSAIQYFGFSHSYAEVIAAIAETINTNGLSAFRNGPFPIFGQYLQQDGSGLFEAFSESLPEALDLWRLMSLDGDYNEDNGSVSAQSLWTGADGGTAIPEIFDRAVERGDFALCDMLIGAWLLFCCLSSRTPLPDIKGLSHRIGSLPAEFRSSIYAVVGSLKREALEDPLLAHEIQTLLSWLPVIEISPPEDVDSFLESVFTPENWKELSKKEMQRLVAAERNFTAMRRQRVIEDDPLLRLLIMEWSSVAEPILRRLIYKLAGQQKLDVARQPLGKLIEIMEPSHTKMGGLLEHLRYNDRPLIAESLSRLSQLNKLNTQGGKHLGERSVSWSDVVSIHAGLYPALKAALDIARK